MNFFLSVSSFFFFVFDLNFFCWGSGVLRGGVSPACAGPLPPPSPSHCLLAVQAARFACGASRRKRFVAAQADASGLSRRKQTQAVCRGASRRKRFVAAQAGASGLSRRKQAQAVCCGASRRKRFACGPLPPPTACWRCGQNVLPARGAGQAFQSGNIKLYK